MSKTITAEFSDFDTAENAVRTIKHHFQDVLKIKVKYKGNTESYGFTNQDQRSDFLPFARYTNEVSDKSYYPDYAKSDLDMVYGNGYDEDLFYEDENGKNEVALRQACTVEITVPDEIRKEVAAKLRNMGGLSVKIR
ncbi:MAG: hypothetical protein K0R90_1739 [Oscillospiraceae bacterium]|jgi:hypothetical protein|nr:hypothetical protein [Oscillospiraceae bacterium]